MFKFELFVSLDSIADPVIHRAKSIIAQITDNTDGLIFIGTEGDTEVKWCPTGNFDKDPIYVYKKYSVYPRDLKMLIKENKKWRSDKRVQIVKENRYMVYKKGNGGIEPIEEIKLNKATKYSDVCKILESYM